VPLAVAEISEWSDLFVASAGATAALAGLVFVAISINIERILQLDGVPELGMVTLLLLVGVLVVSLFGLIPEQEDHAFGIELLVQSVLWTSFIALLTARSASGLGQGEGRLTSRVVLPLFGTVPYLVGAVMLIIGSDIAMYWVFAGMLGAILAAVMNAWILLVEILR
jgi:modulator of FtsH protease